MIAVAICRRHHWHWWLIAAGVIDTSGKFAAVVNDTLAQPAVGVVLLIPVVPLELQISFQTFYFFFKWRY